VKAGLVPEVGPSTSQHHHAHVEDGLGGREPSTAGDRVLNAGEVVLEVSDESCVSFGVFLFKHFEHLIGESRDEGLAAGSSWSGRCRTRSDGVQVFRYDEF